MKFNEQYNLILEKGIKYLLKTYDNINYDEDNLIDIRKGLVTFNKPFKLPIPYKRFHLFKVSNKLISTKSKQNYNLILIDNLTKTVTYFCMNDVKWCSVDVYDMTLFIKKNIGINWKFSYTKPYFKNNFRAVKDEPDIFKLEFKNLIWSLLWMSLKLKNPEFTDDILEEYYLMNIKKRQNIKFVLIDFFAKINK
jgi:hypothetical protein